MPRHFIIAFYCVILILGMILRPHAFATQKWANTCALINVSAISANTNQLTMNNYNIKPIYNSNLSMKAAEIIIKKSNTLSIDNEQYIRINNATSMGLMSLILQHYIPSCNASYYDALLSPFIKKLQDQGSVSFTWNKAIFQKENFVIQISRINIIITSTHKLMHLHLKFFGLSASNSTTEPVLLPRDGSVDMEMDPKTYSILLANQKQNLSSYKTSYPLTINSLMLANATSTLTASGTISINDYSKINAANGTIKLTHIDQLISLTNSFPSKLKMGLILAKFAGKKEEADTLKWHVNFENNIFNVNNVPIPIW